MVTMSDVAKLSGVSTMTVSNVINDRAGVSDQVRRRVLEAIRQSGYRINVSARTLRSGRTGVIGLAVPEIDRPYFGHLATHVIAQAKERGFHVAIEETGAGAAGEIDAIAHSHKLQFDGLILSAVGLDPGDSRLSGGDYPIVMLGEQDFSARFDHVAMPNEEGTKAATAHLIDRGCRRIAIVTGAALDGVNVVTRRYHGYLAALAERGLDADPALRFAVDGMTLAGGRAAAHRLADSGHEVDGVVAVSDTVAQGVLRGLADRGLRVPDDVRLVGFDGIPEAAYTVPSLSTVAPDHRWMAAKAVELVTARIDDPSRPAAAYTAPFDLMLRESTR
ncbi:LacI family DNA-binding transcriptional regulator [Nonomuraea phyllanthi]|uniref:LacI family DNA-binding transcriptional regulator n=1 Tax=Nonomuraea phyllanthi TaxID=2219224 RepID=A0A5C4WBL3_9ACTN|nr:LacI family DNA-binding transcriptional regulator [Nonomuraea phyllanthi]KAB8193041.1 LacI family DNA-binding transcriptional regulator [Nonomuraea phyllanthi]QFY11099.1 LacI family DNA-binding transcriptional regulator [Nonomuraea phyllanthi]